MSCCFMRSDFCWRCCCPARSSRVFAGVLIELAVDPRLGHRRAVANPLLVDGRRCSRSSCLAVAWVRTSDWLIGRGRVGLVESGGRVLCAGLSPSPPAPPSIACWKSRRSSFPRPFSNRKPQSGIDSTVERQTLAVRRCDARRLSAGHRPISRTNDSRPGQRLAIRDASRTGMDREEFTRAGNWPSKRRKQSRPASFRLPRRERRECARLRSTRCKK